MDEWSVAKFVKNLSLEYRIASALRVPDGVDEFHHCKKLSKLELLERLREARLEGLADDLWQGLCGLDAKTRVAEKDANITAEWYLSVPAHLGKAASPLGVSITEFATTLQKLDAGDVAKAKAKADSVATKKKVLMVIDVQDGYDAEFIASLPESCPGSLGYIMSQHVVQQSVELISKVPLQQFARGEKKITYDKVWNRGVDGASFSEVTARVIHEIRDGGYDLVVFTYDYLEKSNGEEKGVFALDSTPWSDPRKPIALVPYSCYLTINAGGLGTDISHRIRSALPDVTNARGADNMIAGTRCLYVRKQADDAFNDHTERSARTLEQDWLDDIDVDDNGLPQPNAQTLFDKLSSRGFGPDEATLHFTGVVTNRCVASTLLHGITLGWEAVLLEGGCCAADAQQHAQGVAIIREKGGDAVEIKP